MTHEWLLIGAQWGAQVLATTAAVWVALGEAREGELDRPTRVRRARLTLAALFVAFLAFGLGDLAERRASRAATRAAEEEVARQELLVERSEREIGYLQQLLRTGQRLMALELSWPLPDDLRAGSLPPELAAVVEDVHRASPGAETDPYFRLKSELHARPEGTGWALRRYRIDRDGALMRVGPFAPADLEYRLFERYLVQGILNDRFWIESSRDKYLVELPGRDWPCEVRVLHDRVVLTLRRPEISLFDLEGASVTFCMRAPLRPEALPTEIRLRSLDSRFALDQTVALDWHRREVLERPALTVDWEPGAIPEYEHVSGPHALRGTAAPVDARPAGRAR